MRGGLFLSLLQCVLELGSAAHMGHSSSADAVVTEGPGLLRLCWADGHPLGNHRLRYSAWLCKAPRSWHGPGEVSFPRIRWLTLTSTSQTRFAFGNAARRKGYFYWPALILAGRPPTPPLLPPHCSKTWRRFVLCLCIHSSAFPTLVCCWHLIAIIITCVICKAKLWLFIHCHIPVIKQF